MIREHLRDGAVAAAKGWGHAAVEPRHLAYAIARHFKDRPEFGELLERARSALEPRGLATETPAPSDATEAHLRAIDSPEDALIRARSILNGIESPDTAPAAAPETPVATASEEGLGQEAVSVEPALAAEPAAESVSQVLAELDGLIGLESVKEQVRRVVAVVQANQTRVAAGLPAVNPGLHLVFTGPPGTGKTTVARLIARLYAASGALPGANFTEVDRSDLVAGYVGQTAMKTAEVVRKTRPGVLFVDEAYALTPSSPQDFGSEAIATLVKAMEDHRDELAVIVAGYGDEMSDFVGSNPGLRSRFKTFIDFPDYDPGELGAIFRGFVENAGLELGEGALDRARELFRRARERSDFGNARFARSLFEQAYARLALRAAEDGVVTVDELQTLSADDLEWVEPGVANRRFRIGFGADDGGGPGGGAP